MRALAFMGTHWYPRVFLPWKEITTSPGREREDLAGPLLNSSIQVSCGKNTQCGPGSVTGYPIQTPDTLEIPVAAALPQILYNPLLFLI